MAACLLCRDDPNALKEELKEIIRVEESGQLNPSLKIKKKALQQAYDQAIRKQILAKKVGVSFVGICSECFLGFCFIKKIPHIKGFSCGIHKWMSEISAYTSLKITS